MAETPRAPGRLRRYLRSVFDIRQDTMSHEELHAMMQENTIIHGSNMWILIMAIFIASIGLNVNSTAVIIGAMLISPLMSGILTMGFSLATKDLTMLKKAFMRFMTQVVISLMTSTLYFVISPLDVPTSEMIARTSPTLWDVLIALFGGIAGMIGNTRQKKSNVIPGVAIATALMPPLCTAGYGLATMQPGFFLGAFYLFAINTLFIMLSAALVTRLLRVPYHESADDRRQRRVQNFITVITIITVIPATLAASLTVYSAVQERSINNYIETEFQFPNTQVVRSSTDRMDKRISVSLVGETLSEAQLSRLEESLARYGLEEFTLRVTQNVAANWEESDKVTIAIQENTIQSLREELAEAQDALAGRDEALTALEQQAAQVVDCGALAAKAEQIFPWLEGTSVGIMERGSRRYILLAADTAAPLTADQEQVLCNWLQAETGLSAAKLHLTVTAPEDDGSA